MSYKLHGAGEAVPAMAVYVSAGRDRDHTQRQWAPVAEYLRRALDGVRVALHVTDASSIETAIATGEADFVVVDAGHYLRLEAGRRASRMACVRYAVPGTDGEYSRQAAVIVARRERDDINEIADLRGKSFMGVDAHSLGGFQMAWGALLSHGIDPYVDLSALRFSGVPQDQVVDAVTSGEVDAGTVEAEVLAAMIAEDRIAAGDIKVLNPRASQTYPFPRSTELFPSRVFAALPSSKPAQVRAVAVALLGMPASAATDIAGLDPVPDFSPVHALYRELQIAPYDREAEAALSDAAQNCWPLIRAVSHDLRTPLNVILSLTDLMRDVYEEAADQDAEIRSYLDEVYEAGMRMTELVFEITDFARAESGQQVGGYEIVALNELTDEIELMLGENARDSDLKFDVRMPEGWTSVKLPELRIKPILFNLLYGMARLRGTQQISVGFAIEGDLLHVTVQWRGAQSADPIQDTFWEVPISLKAAAGSARQFGVWMFISSRLVETQGGRLWTQRQGPAVRCLHIELPVKSA